MTIFPRSLVWNVIQESAKKPTSSNHISTNIAREALKFGPEVQHDVFSNGFFLASETSQKKIYSENSTMTYLEQRNPRIQSFDTKCQETSLQKDKKIDQLLRIQPLRGGNLLYITQMNNSWMIQMTKPPFYIQESKGSQYNQADLTIII